MKRKIICAALFILTIICILCAACVKPPEALEAPQNMQIWGREISWDKVEGAEGYVVFFKDKEYEIEESEYTLSDSVQPGEYMLEVMSVGNDVTTLDSGWSEYTFTLYDAVEHGYDEKGFEYKLLEDGTGYEISQGRISRETYVNLDLPDKYLGYPVKQIGRWGFTVPGVSVVRDEQDGLNCNILTKSLKFPSRLEKIDDFAFTHVIYLTEVVFPDTLVEIGNNAFSVDVRLKKVQFNEGLKIIGDRSFLFCAIEELVFPQSLEVIGASAFLSYDPDTKFNKNNFGAQKFTSVVIPENVKVLGSGAFHECTNLEKITILSKHIEDVEIGAGIMDGVRKKRLNTAWLEAQPEGWIYLREGVLYGYKGEWAEEEVYKVPSDVKNIAGGAFRESKFKEVILPDGIKILNDALFDNCKNLSRLVIPESVNAIKVSVFWQCTSLKEIVIPAGVTEIGQSAFYGCTELTRMAVPEGVSTIEIHTFANCSNLTEITLPQSISLIKRGAFNNCVNLHTINFGGTMQQWKNLAKEKFWFKDGEFTVYCLDGKLDQNNVEIR